MPLHVRHRGHNRGCCFFAEGDYRLYLRLLEEHACKHDCAVHAYCLMTNHVHLLVTPHTGVGLAQMMKYVAQLYTQRVNWVHTRTGSLWEGRFRSCPVPTKRYLLACYRYVELNPVAAGMVGQPGDYPWSSYRANAEGRQTGLINRHPACPEPAAYRALFDEGLDPSEAADIRRATAGGFAAGSERRKRGRPKIGSVPI